MSRWAEAFNAIETPVMADTVDSVDTWARLDVRWEPAEALQVDALSSYSVNRVHSVSPGNDVDIEGIGLDDRTALQRCPSWSNPADAPSDGSWCSCCDGHLWWTEAQDGRGWCCATCHPGDHLTAAQRREVRT